MGSKMMIPHDSVCRCVKSIHRAHAAIERCVIAASAGKSDRENTISHVLWEEKSVIGRRAHNTQRLMKWLPSDTTCGWSNRRHCKNKDKSINSVTWVTNVYAKVSSRSPTVSRLSVQRFVSLLLLPLSTLRRQLPIAVTASEDCNRLERVEWTLSIDLCVEYIAMHAQMSE